MRIKDPISEGEEPYNLVPLTDMVFNLLIFFMAATTFAQVEKELGLQLPKTTAFSTLSVAPQQLTINISQDGSPVVMRKTYDMKGLSELLTAAVRKNKDASVLIRADERGYVKGFATVVDVCKRAGVREAKIGYLTGGTGS